MAGGYVIFGKTFQAYQLSVATLLTTAVGIAVATSGKKEAKPAPAAVPAAAVTTETSGEDDFITQFLASVEKEEK